MTEQNFEQNSGEAGDRQDPADQYSTESEVQTEPQPGDAGDESGADETGDEPADPEPSPDPVEVAPEDHNAGHNLQAPESGDVSQEPAPHVNGLGMTYSEERGHRMA